jgi:UrcA family protein
VGLLQQEFHMTTSIRRLALAAAAAGALFAGSAAFAQDDGNTNNVAYTPADAESVIVEAPYNIQADRQKFGLPAKLTASRAVPFSDLNLATRDGARELRQRVRAAAQDICRTLDDASGTHEQPGATKCYEGALKNGMVRADAAIADARY